jgi:hypothetical protein
MRAPAAALLVLCAFFPPGTARAESGPPREGIQVHGRWSITVREADGSLVSRYQFDNALDSSAVLANLLGRASSVGRWYVRFNSNPALCQDPAGPPIPACIVSEQGTPGKVASTDLVTSVVATGAKAANLVLVGSFRARFDGAITEVATAFDSCPPTQAPANGVSPGCNDIPVQLLTGRDLVTHPLPGHAGAIPIRAGQTVDVTVVISFS